MADTSPDTILALGDGPSGNIRVGDLFATSDALERAMREFLDAERAYLAERTDATLRAMMQAAGMADRALADYRAFRGRMRW